MRTALSVRMVVDSGGPWRGLQLVTVAGGASILLGWSGILGGMEGWPLAVLVAAGCAVAVAVAAQGVRGGRHALTFDGGRWFLEGRPVAVGVMLDLEPWMLLVCAEPDGRCRRVWAGARVTDSRTRAALYLFVPQ